MKLDPRYHGAFPEGSVAGISVLIGELSGDANICNIGIDGVTDLA